MTVGVPVWNGERFLREALASLTAQDYDDFEIVISDNGSTDGTEEICRDVAASDERVSFVRHPVNRGASWNYNFLVHHTSGRYFKWAACDDVHAPGWVARCAAVLDDDPTAVLSYSQVVEIDEDGLELKRHGPMPQAVGSTPARRFGDQVLNLRLCFSSFGLMRRSALERTGLILPYVGSDMVLLAELALYGRFVEVPEDLFLHRKHEDRSVRVFRAPRGEYSRIAWFDTSKTGKVTFPRWRLALEYAKAVQRWDGLPAERAEALGYVPRWMAANRSQLAGDLVDAARALSRGRGAVCSPPSPSPAGEVAAPLWRGEGAQEQVEGEALPWRPER